MSQAVQSPPGSPALQVLIPASRTLVAGLPPALRSAHRAAGELPGARIILCGQDPDFPRRFRRQLAGLPARCLDGSAADPAVDSSAALLVLSGDGFPAADALKTFIERAREGGTPLTWREAGRTVAAYFPAGAAAAVTGAAASVTGAAAAASGSGSVADAAARLLAAEAPAQAQTGWIPAADAAQSAAAARALFASLPKDNDGYIARFDRKLSMALSAVFLRLPVTPNDITTASLVLGLLGAWWLASGRYGLTLAGAVLLWFCCLLDGCDGEVARLKLLCSPSGAAYDLAADHLAHLATFVAIPVGVHRAFPAASFTLPGALLVSGFLACMFSVWYLVLRKPESERGKHALLIERVASRDYVYLIALLALVGRLDWFLYAAGVGSHVFWAVLWLVA